MRLGTESGPVANGWRSPWSVVARRNELFLYGIRGRRLVKKRLEEILQLLPKYRVVELWPEKVLLENLSGKNEIDA